MEIGFASLIGIEPMPFPDLVRRAASHGLDAIEVNVGSGYPRIGGAAFPGHLDVDAIARDGPGGIPELLQEHGIRISSLAPMVNLLIGDHARRADRLVAFRTTIDACVRLGVSTVVTFAGSAYGMHFWGMPGVAEDHPSNHVRDNLRIFRSVYGPLAEYAEQRGVRIAFETAGRGGPEGNLAHSPYMWERMFDLVPSRALGLSFDPSHLVWLHVPDIPGLIRTFGARILHVDGKDTEILHDRLARQGILGSGWWRYRLPGLGVLDWRGICSALRETGYDDVISIENEDPLCPGFAGMTWAAEYLRGQLLPPRREDAASGIERADPGSARDGHDVPPVARPALDNGNDSRGEAG